MKKSIEDIWKEGFINNEKLTAPKINDLYNQKSIHLVDKFRRDFKLNLIYIIFLSLFFLGAGIFLNAVYSGIVIFLLLISLLVYGKKRLDIINKLDYNDNSYKYLKSFDDWLQATLKGYTLLYQIFYPVFFLAIAGGVWFSPIGEKVMQKFPDLQTVLGLPLYPTIVVFSIAILLIFLAKRLYELDMNLIYKSQMDKLKDLLADMEELRA
ncbi:hypothetical protein [Sediminitomix flava]|uniref:Uncharacterized protein n=1 Tax=Sediminitomix flava TaxID=379075 RepID=A0A315ZA44_SEDFL|nr:hypothetical protein [Sediminitomix flava]PWJ41074.1 hypothetical protein BC781_104349 [Sediminitomix flava]